MVSRIQRPLCPLLLKPQDQKRIYSVLGWIIIIYIVNLFESNFILNQVYFIFFNSQSYSTNDAQLFPDTRSPFYLFRDRKKNVIKKQGELLSPETLIVFKNYYISFERKTVFVPFVRLIMPDRLGFFICAKSFGVYKLFYKIYIKNEKIHSPGRSLTPLPVANTLFVLINFYPYKAICEYIQ